MFKLALLSMFLQYSVASFSPYVQIIFRNKGYSYSLVGVLIALSQLASCIIPMLVSSLSDKRGRTKPYIILSALMSILFAIPLLSSSPLFVVVLATIVMNGFFWCLNPLIDGFLSRGLEGESSKYGLIRGMGTFSYMLALALFGVLSWPHETDNASIRTSILLALSLLLVMTILVPEKRSGAKKEKGKFFSFSWFPRSFYIYMAIAAITRVAQVVPDRFLSSYMTEEMGLGSYFSVFIALGALFEFFCLIYGGKLLKKGKGSPWFFLLLSSIGMVARLALYLLPGIVPFVLGQALHGLTFGIFHIGVTTFVSKEVDPEHYDMAMSIYWSLATNFPQMIGALLGGYVIDWLGYKALFSSYLIFPLLAIFLSVLYRRQLQEGQN